jgi:DNA-binding cell septation regulator SpoVG
MSLTFGAKVTTLQNPKGALRAFATLVINDTIHVNGFRVLEGSKGTFVSAPQKKGSKPDENGKDVYYDEVRFVEETEEGQFRGPIAEAAFKAILDAYAADNSTGGSSSSRPEPSGDRPKTRAARW